jgi:uncharacterized phage protein gp47/JayE
MSGLTAAGFERKRLTDIKTNIEAALKLAFGNNIDLEPESGFGQFVGILSEALSDQWESQENVYNSQYPSTAQGNQLSNVVMYNGIDRQEATNSTVTGTILGVVGTNIPTGSKASVASTGDIFVTLEDVIIPVGGSVPVQMQSEETGAIKAASGTLTVIETPIFGWTSITNSADATVGQEEETDAKLRERREQSTQALGNNLVDALFGQLLNLEGVEDALVISNGTDATVDGIPPHQFLTSILGGVDADIASTIWANTPQGILSFGATTVAHTDVQGFLQDVKFSRPSEIDIYFKVDITVNTAEFPETGEDDIKAAIVAYGLANFKISDDVIRTKFYTPINTIPGILTIDLFIGLSASPSGTANLTIDLDEISRYAVARVEVNIV